MEEVNKTEDKQKDEKIEVEEVNKLDKLSRSNYKSDEPSESSGLDCLFVLTI